MYTSSTGYRVAYVKGSGRAKRRLAGEAVLIVEKVLGHRLCGSHEVHHINMVRNDNRHENLVVCENHYYHALLHVRTRALKESGDANNRWCRLCKKWDSPGTDLVRMVRSDRENGEVFRHRSCHAQEMRRGRG